MKGIKMVEIISNLVFIIVLLGIVIYINWEDLKR